MTKRINNYTKILKFYFENNGVDISENEIQKIIVSLKHLGVYNFYSEEDYCYYYLIMTTAANRSAEKIINKLPADFDPKNNCKILLVVNNIQDKLYINTPKYKKDFKNALTKKLSLKKRINTIRDISAEFISFATKKHEISITNRVDSLQYDLSKTTGINNPYGYVYIASLYDIVNMYNVIGDSLFDLNVRYKISDELDVEKEIKKTLNENPQEFWFNNNGITMIANKDKFNCDRPSTIEFLNSNFFSVINGAQTITTAAKWYNESEKDKENLKKAWVLLRVILVDDIDQSFAKDVSVSLNRQKSISEVDIATTYEFVENINSVMNECENDNICFELNKRGGTPTYKYSYYIDDFAQLVEAYMIQKPGSARSSKGALISVKEINGKYEFLHKDIFKKVKTSNDILKYYTPVNYAYELVNSYKKAQKNLSYKDTFGEIFSKYGNMYCVASVIYCINDKQVDDFSTFEYIDVKYNTDIIQKFIDSFESFLKSINKPSLDSNDFKKEELYQNFKESTYMSELWQYVLSLKKLPKK